MCISIVLLHWGMQRRPHVILQAFDTLYTVCHLLSDAVNRKNDFTTFSLCESSVHVQWNSGELQSRTNKTKSHFKNENSFCFWEQVKKDNRHGLLIRAVFLWKTFLGVDIYLGAATFDGPFIYFKSTQHSKVYVNIQRKDKVYICTGCPEYEGA